MLQSDMENVDPKQNGLGERGEPLGGDSKKSLTSFLEVEERQP